MKVLVVGASGTIGGAVAAALEGRHEVVRASRRGPHPLDLEDAASVRALLDAVPDVAAVVCCAGRGAFKPLDQLTDEDLALSVRSKLLGQVHLARVCRERLPAGGSITLTSGMLAVHPTIGGAALGMVNAGVEAFVRAAALDLPRGLRINVVSPPWVKETLRKLGRDDAIGVAASELAQRYVELVDGTQQGEVVRVDSV